MTFHLTNKAKEDLRNIAFYTQKEWEIEQRNFYLKQIDEIFHIIAKAPSKGRNCDNIRQDYYKKSVGKHIIFYRVISKKEVQIVRILHENMDLPNHL